MSNAISLDGVQLNFLTPATPLDYVETDGQPIDHIAFSVPDLDAMFERAQMIGVEIVAEPAQTECSMLRSPRPCRRSGAGS